MALLANGLTKIGLAWHAAGWAYARRVAAGVGLSSAVVVLMAALR